MQAISTWSGKRSGWTTRSRVDILEHEHLRHSLFIALGESASVHEATGILEGAEQAIPQRQVSVVEAVDTQLVMDRVMLRALDHESNPDAPESVGVSEPMPPVEGMPKASPRRNRR
jgi:hypothetical protein